MDGHQLIGPCQEIYERSIQIEGPGVGEIRRRFNWFQR